MKSNSSNRKPPLSKKELEKQKLIEEKEAEAAVLQQFVETFEKPNPGIKTFVKGATINGPSGEQNTKNQIYKPSKLLELEAKKELVKQNQPKQQHQHVSKMDKPPKKKKVEKPKSNLELFKEELKMMQEEREGKLKGIFKKDDDNKNHHFKKNEQFINKFDKMDKDDKHKIGSDEFNKQHTGGSTYGLYDNSDPNTTNIYLGNISPKCTEQDLMNIFGKYGPLASVKVMWPRTDEERARNRNCGFVAYMCRKDAERAIKNLNGKEILGYEMKLGWGKIVPIPPMPVFIPIKLRELTLPPPPSGLPFNAQPNPKDLDKLPPPGTPLNIIAKSDNFKEILKNSTVKVVKPADHNLLCLIHRMIEFVVREGPMFEAMIMNREISNPMFRFLFDNQSPEHVYYRWRLYSVLQGDHPSKWRTECFRMFKDGPLWKPPLLNATSFLDGMPEELIEDDDNLPLEHHKSSESNNHNKSPKNNQHSTQRNFKESKEKKKMLTDSERETFEDLLRDLTPERSKIQEAMIYCIEHAESAEEIVECITQSLSISDTELHKKIARIYLISDILHNCTVKVSNASFYRKGFQSKLTKIFESMHKCYESIDGRMKAEHFKQRVMNCLKAWTDWTIYSSDFLIKCQNIFLGLVKLDNSSVNNNQNKAKEKSESIDLDGLPLEDVDGVPLDDSQIKFKVSKWETIDDDDLDGKPIDVNMNNDDIDGIPLDSNNKIEDDTSKSNSIEFEKLKQQLNFLNSEEKHMVLREIEVKVLKYEDDLDSGKEKRKSSVSLRDQLEDFRIKLLKKYLTNLKNDNYDNRQHLSRSRSPKSDRRHRNSRSPKSERRYRNSRSPKSERRHKDSRSPRSERRHKDSPRSERNEDSRSPRSERSSRRERSPSKQSSDKHSSRSSHKRKKSSSRSPHRSSKRK